MLSWLIDSLDVATATQALQTLASVAVSKEAFAGGVLLGLAGLTSTVLAVRANSVRKRSKTAKKIDPASILAAYAARLPANATHTEFEIANAEAVLAALAAQRKSAGKAQRARIVDALNSAGGGDFQAARTVFEESALKERARWRLQRAKIAATLRHIGTCARITDMNAALDAFAQACELEPTSEVTLLMLAKLRLEAGQIPQAEPVLDRLISLSERASDPRVLVYALLLRGDCRSRQGRLAQAAVDYQRAGDICRGQPQTDEASNSDWQRPLALAYAGLGELEQRQGQNTPALEHLISAQRIQSHLVHEEPSDMDALRDLANSCDHIGELQLAKGDVAAALTSFSEAHTMTRRLAESHPQHAELQRDYAVACSRMGEVLRVLQRLPEALEAFRDDLAVSSRLVDGARGDKRRQHDLAVSYANVGDMLCALGKAREALVSFEAAREILDYLSEVEPDNEEFEHELALMLTRIGNAHARLNGQDKAFEAFTAVLATAAKRAEAVPNDMARQHELAQAHTRLGNLHLMSAELEKAVASFNAARNVVTALSDGEHADVALRRELAMCHGRIALARARGDAREDALQAFQAGHTVLASINGGSEVLVAKDKAWFEGQIAALEVTQAFTLQPLPAKKVHAEPV